MGILKMACLLALLALAAASSQAQQHAPSADSDAPAKPAPQSATNPAVIIDSHPIHRLWDRQNDLWFAAVGAGRALDYASSLNMRRRGVDEIFLTNGIVDNHP